MRMALTMSCASCSTSDQSAPIARLNGVRVLSQMRTNLAASRGLTLLRKNSRSVPEAVHIKMLLISNSSTQKAAAQAAGHWSLRCLLYVRFADESCSAQKKVSCLFASRMRALGTARPAMAVEITSLTFAVRCKPAISPAQSQLGILARIRIGQCEHQ